MPNPFRMGRPLGFAEEPESEEAWAEIIEPMKIEKLLDAIPGFHFTQPNAKAYFDIAPNVHVHSPGYPNRFHRFWQRVLLGWRWRRL